MKKVTVLSVMLAVILLAGCAQQPGTTHPYPLQADRIRADTEYMCNVIGIRLAGTDKEREACDWLQEQLEGMGFSEGDGTLERTCFEGFPGVNSENLIATCNPDSDGPIFCVMAHYDTAENTPGARDNTASVATLLELARYLGTRQEDLNAQVRFLFLGSEENGYHYCFGDGHKPYVPEPFENAIDHILVKDISEGAVRRFDRYCPDYYLVLSDHAPVYIDLKL